MDLRLVFTMPRPKLTITCLILDLKPSGSQIQAAL
jgi:hypothetical protein